MLKIHSADIRPALLESCPIWGFDDDILHITQDGHEIFVTHSFLRHCIEVLPLVLSSQISMNILLNNLYFVELPNFCDQSFVFYMQRGCVSEAHLCERDTMCSANAVHWSRHVDVNHQLLQVPSPHQHLRLMIRQTWSIHRGKGYSIWEFTSIGQQLQRNIRHQLNCATRIQWKTCFITVGLEYAVWLLE